MDTKGTLKFELEGLSNEDNLRYHEMMNLVIMQGVFNVRNGKVILNFDSEGLLQEIEFQIKKYRRKSVDKMKP